MFTSFTCQSASLPSVFVADSQIIWWVMGCMLNRGSLILLKARSTQGRVSQLRGKNVYHHLQGLMIYRIPMVTKEAEKSQATYIAAPSPSCPEKYPAWCPQQQWAAVLEPSSNLFPLIHCTNSGLETSDSGKSNREMAGREQATRRGFVTGVGSTSEQQARLTCLMTFLVSLSIGRERSAKLSNFKVSRVAISPRRDMYVTYISYREPLEERPRSPEDPADVFVSLDGNLVTRVFWLFGQRVNAREDSGDDWGHQLIRKCF